MLPWPSNTPEPDSQLEAAALYGPGIALFGSEIVNALHCQTVNTNDAGTPPELTAVVERCGGAANWKDSVAACLATLCKQPGGLVFNWIKLGTVDGGPFGICCLTCGGPSTGFAMSGRSSPFNNFTTNHLKGRRHERARDALLAQVEAAAAAGGRPRIDICVLLRALLSGQVGAR
jgi:hypothetical protein